MTITITNVGIGSNVWEVEVRDLITQSLVMRARGTIAVVIAAVNAYVKELP